MIRAYRADRPAIRRAEASVFPSYFSQLKSWIFFSLNFPSLGLMKIIEKHYLSPIMKILQVFFKNRGETFMFKKKCWFPWVFWVYFVLWIITSKNFFFQKLSLTKTVSLLLYFMEFGWISADDWKQIKSRLKADGWKAGFLYALIVMVSSDGVLNNQYSVNFGKLPEVAAIGFNFSKILWTGKALT